MTVLLAALAGVAAAAGITDLIAARAARRPAPPRRPGAALTRLLGRLGRRVGRPAPPRDLQARLAAAGVALPSGDAMAIKAGAAAAGLLAALPPSASAPGRTAPLVLVAGPAAGFVALDALLARRAALRARRMEAELSDVLDLLRVAVQAGLPAVRALGEVGARHGGVLAEELRAVAERVELGELRAAALARLAARAPLAGVRALVAAIDRADRHGTPLAPALVALAADARAERSRRIRERGARAAPRIQLVIALLLVPAVMLLVAAALAASLL